MEFMSFIPASIDIGTRSSGERRRLSAHVLRVFPLTEAAEAFGVWLCENTHISARVGGDAVLYSR